MPGGGLRVPDLALGLTVASLLMLGVAVFVVWPARAAAFWIAVLTGLMAVALIHVLLPRRYEIWPDRLRIVFPFWRWDVAFDSLEYARPSKWWEAYAFMGMRFATDPGQAIVVQRRDPRLFTRPHLVISPADRMTFLSQLDNVMRARRDRT